MTSRRGLNWTLFLMAALAAPFGTAFSSSACDAASRERMVVHSSADKSFSLSIPDSWSAESSRPGDAAEMMIKAAGNCKVRILVASRPLDAKERALSSIELVSAMISSSVDHIRSKGHVIESYGRYKSFRPGAPAFVIISSDPSKGRTVLSYGSASVERNLSIVVLSSDSQRSAAVGELIRAVVDSVRF